MAFISVAQAAEALGVRPRDVSDLIYGRKVRIDHYPLVGGRRLIHRGRLPELRKALQRKAVAG